jgi:hypothetical protein
MLISAGRVAHVMSFEVGAVLEDAAWQAPEYCFSKGKEGGGITGDAVQQGSSFFFIPRDVL